MQVLAKTMTEMMVEMIQLGCCGCDVPPDINYEGKTLDQCLEDACQELLGSSAADSFYKASTEGHYLSIAD